MGTTSFWQTTGPLREFPPLRGNLNVDAVVIGGGNTGITAAYLMKKAGLKVVLLERDRCANADTAHTSAHLTHVTDHRATDLISKLGRDHAQAVWDAGDAAIQQIDEIVHKENIDCGFAHVPGYISASLDNEADERDDLHADIEAIDELGFSATYVDNVPLYNRPGIRVPNQARFHPRKYLARLLERIAGGGCRVFEQTEVKEIAEPLTVRANGHEVSAKFVFIATDVPLQGKTGTMSATLFQSKIIPYTSYCIGAKLP